MAIVLKTAKTLLGIAIFITALGCAVWVVGKIVLFFGGPITVEN